MKAHPKFLFGWLIAATFMLSLVGLTAEPSPASEVGVALTNSFSDKT